MQKNKLARAVLCAAGLTLAACGSGNQQNSNNTPTITLHAITVPAGFSQIGAAGSSPVMINLAAGEIAWPVNATYQAYTIPAELLTALNALTPTEIAAIKVSASAGKLVPLTLLFPDNTVYVLTPAASSSSIADNNIKPTATTFTLTLSSFTIPTSVQVTSNSLTAIFNGTTGTMFGGTDKSNGNNNLYLINPDTKTVITTFPTTDCTGVDKNATVTTVSAVKFQNQDYAAFGTNTGSVCVFATLNGKPTITNLSAQAPAPGKANSYIHAQVNNFGFYTDGSNQLLGFWLVGAPNGAQQIYRVTGQSGAAGSGQAGTGIIGKAFWNTTSNAAQSSGGTTQQFTNVPTSVTDMNVDSTGTVIAAANGGVSALPIICGNGQQTQWTQAATSYTSSEGQVTSLNGKIITAFPSADGTSTTVMVTFQTNIQATNPLVVCPSS